MTILPVSKQEWFSLLLFPFKAYAVIFPILCCFYSLEPFDVRVAQTWVMHGLELGYFCCIPIFTLAALIQITAHRREAAIMSLVFALAIMVSIFFLLPLLALARG